MTREEQKKLKELKQALPKLLKDNIKKYKLKKKDFMIWDSKKGLFFDLLIDVRVLPDGKCYCLSSEKIKPLWLDDLLWDLLKMESNKDQPLSLRAVGAFTVSGSEIFKDQTELTEWSMDELTETIDTYLEHFYKSVQTSEIDDFYNNLTASTYHSELRKILSLVYKNQYQEALDDLSEMSSSNFKNGDISINDAIREYCENQLLLG